MATPMGKITSGFVKNAQKRNFQNQRQNRQPLQMTRVIIPRGIEHDERAVVSGNEGIERRVSQMGDFAGLVRPLGLCRSFFLNKKCYV